MNAVATGYAYEPPRIGRRKVTGWKKKLDAILAKAPVLCDENPHPVIHRAECAYVRKADADCDCPERAREINCRRYDTCLDYAIAHDWPGFHCGACDVDDELTLDEQRAQAAGVYRLWRII